MAEGGVSGVRMALLALCLLASGCAAPAPVAGHAQAPPVQVERLPVSFPAGAGRHAGPLPFHATEGAVQGGPVGVGPGALVMEVEAAWSCASPTCDLRLDLQGPGGTHAGGPWGGSPLRARVEAPAPGRWGVALFPDGVVAGVAGELLVTVRYAR